MKVAIYLATQTFRDGRVMYRRCTAVDIYPSVIPGGTYAKHTPEAAQWLQKAKMPSWESRPTFAGLEPFEWVEL